MMHLNQVRKPRCLIFCQVLNTLLILIASPNAWAAPAAVDCSGAITRETNRNADVALEEYNQTNDRTFSAYETHFGGLFTRRFPTKSWLDNGAGFGLAALDALVKGRVDHAVVTNAQNALQPMRDKNYDWFRKYSNFKTGRLNSFVGKSLFDAAMISPEDGIWKPNAVEILVEGGAEKLSELEQSGQFKYLTGYTETILPTLKQKFKLITDLFGAYFYSANRLTLLTQYYEKLSTDGQALIIIRAHDIGWRYKSTTKTHNAEISEYGPQNLVKRKDGRTQRFEDYLVEVYPTVFSLQTTNAEKQYAIARHAVLIVKRDVRFSSIDILKTLELEEIQYGAEGIQQQIPSVTYKEL